MLFGKQPPKIDYDKMLNYSNKIPTRISPMRKNTTRQFSLENLLQNQIINPSYISPNENINMNGVNIEPIIQDTQLSNQESIIQPSENEIGNTDSQRFLASLLGQGISMFGAGIAGRNPSAVASNIEELRYYNDRLESERKAREERQKQEQEIFKERQLQRNESIKQSQDLMNPQSEISKRQRMLYSRFLGNIPEDVSASDLKDPVVLRGLQEQQMKLQMPKGSGVRQPTQAKPEKEKKNPYQKEINEITIRSKNSLEALDKIEDIVSKYGTTEFTGPQGKILEQLIKSVAIDYNKIKDPNSVVRSEEAESVASSLGLGGIQGFFTSKGTALQQIKAFKDQLNKQKENALSIYQNPNAIDLQSNEIDFTKE